MKQLLLLFLFLLPLVAPAATAPELGAAMAERTQRVPEFQFLREEAKKLGVRAWLFGGTAAAYGHYVKWDLDREGGDRKYLPERFDYDYTNIYRSTQDLDVVIDGSPEQAEALRAALKQEYPHLQGAKDNSAWEVRLLRQSVGDKLAILDNPDFLNQHTDSNSVGMVEVTETPKGEPPVRDVMDWNAKEPNFLKDVQAGELHYYFNPQHGATRFAREGRNPPILSVIRYLTKALQFELKLRPDDVAQVKKVIAAFDPAGPDAKNPYVRRWLLEKDNGRKLIQNAVNMEYAEKLLREVGLTEKLLAIPGNDPHVVGSLAWWLNKKPLASKPLGRGPGATAASLGIDVVAHETGDYLAYESITKSPKGEPNVFVSRTNATGEAAGHGEGFYVQMGRKGGRDTGITVRFHLDPRARLGEDFTRAGDIIVVKNRNALKVIPESLNWDLPEYFAFLLDEESFDGSNRAQFERLNRRLSRRKRLHSDDEVRSIFHAALAKLKEAGRLPSSQGLTDLTKEYPAIVPGLQEQISDVLRTFPAPQSDVDLLRYRLRFPALLPELHALAEHLAETHPTRAVVDFLLASGAKREVAVKGIAGLLRLREPGMPLEAAWALDQLKDGAEAEGVLDELVRDWLAGKASPAPEIVSTALVRSPTARARARDRFQLLADYRRWPADQAASLKTFREAYDAATWRRWSELLKLPGGTGCAVYYAGLSPAGRAARTAASVALTGAAAGYTIHELALAQDDREDFRARFDTLKESFAKATQPADFVRALAATGLEARGPAHSKAEPAFRHVVSELVAKESARFLAAHPSGAEIAAYGRWLELLPDRVQFWRELPKHGARAADYIAAFHVPEGEDPGPVARAGEMLPLLSSAFLAHPNADEAQELYALADGWPSSILEAQREVIEQAQSPEDILPLYERSSRHWASWPEAMKKLRTFPLTSKDIDRLADVPLSPLPPRDIMSLRLAGIHGQRNVLALFQATTTDGELELLGRALERESERDPASPADFRAAQNACRTVFQCRTLAGWALDAARSPADFVSAATPVSGSPGNDYLTDLGAEVARHAPRFFAWNPSAADFVSLQRALAGSASWHAFAEQAALRARTPAERFQFLSPSAYENAVDFEYPALWDAFAPKYLEEPIDESTRKDAIARAVNPLQVKGILRAATRRANTAEDFLRALEGVRPERPGFADMVKQLFDEESDHFFGLHPTPELLARAWRLGFPVEAVRRRYAVSSAPDWAAAKKVIEEGPQTPGELSTYAGVIAERADHPNERAAVLADVRAWRAKASNAADQSALTRVLAHAAPTASAALALFRENSANGRDLDRGRTYDLAADDFLAKHPTQPELLAYMEELSHEPTWIRLSARCVEMSPTAVAARPCFQTGRWLFPPTGAEWRRHLYALEPKLRALGVDAATAEKVTKESSQFLVIALYKKLALEQARTPAEFFRVLDAGTRDPDDEYWTVLSRLWGDSAEAFAATKPTLADFRRLDDLGLLGPDRSKIRRAAERAGLLPRE